MRSLILALAMLMPASSAGAKERFFFGFSAGAGVRYRVLGVYGVYHQVNAGAIRYVTIHLELAFVI